MGSLTTGFAKCAVVISGMALASMAATASPLVPIVSFLQHWDHHWYVWLPSDPVYEAVEIMAAERGPNNPPLLWVFFTERAQPKHQINYYNDAKVAAARATDGATSQFTEIKFAMTGADGEPRGVSAEFFDFQNRQVAIEVNFDPEARLSTTNAGLTDQIGHSGERLLLLFFRERAARAQNPHVTIDGTDVAKPQPDQTFPAPFAAAYSNNIFVGGFPFMGLDVSFDGGAGTSSRGVHFVPTGPDVYEAAPPHTGRITLLTTFEGGLADYQQHDRTGAHMIDIRFDPPLPSADQLSSEAQSAFQISLDNFRHLFAGEIRVRRDGASVMMDWRFGEPAWARSRVLRATALFSGDGISHLDLRPLKNEQ